MDMWAAVGHCKCFSFQLSYLVITLDSVYIHINHTDGKTALFTYFGHSQQLWSLSSSLHIVTFPTRLSILSLISFLPSRSPSNHILSFFFFLKVLLPFLLFFYHFIPFLFYLPKHYLCYFKSLFIWLYYFISVFSSLVYRIIFGVKHLDSQTTEFREDFIADFLIKFVKYLNFLVQIGQKQQPLSLKVQVLEHINILIS
jgi:hypothetical protein